jgi:serine/threonine protein phosphatase PrpC
MEPEEICETIGTIGQPATIEEACAALIDCANSRGGHDNITAVILST